MLGSALAMTLLSGCALRYADRRGNLTTLGFVCYTVPPAKSSEERTSRRTRVVFGPETFSSAPLALRQQALGVIIDYTAHHKGLTIGLQDSLLVFPADEGISEFDYDSLHPTDARLRLK